MAAGSGAAARREEVRGIASGEARLRAIAAADVRYRIDSNGGDVLARVGDKWEVVDAGGQRGSALPILFAGNVEGDLVRTACGWRVAAATRVGKSDSSRNDDGVLLEVESERKLLAAVADGTGDSAAGFRASYLALQGLAESFSFGASLVSAVECAAGRVRADNLARRSDGVTTMVACVLEGKSISIIAIGDPVYAVLDESGGLFLSPTTHDHRCALGGEPLGFTITSSGRLVENLLIGDSKQVLERDRVCDVVLGSDGLLAGSQEWSNEVVGKELQAAANAEEAVICLVARSITAICQGAKADNVTALVARHMDESSGGQMVGDRQG